MEIYEATAKPLVLDALKGFNWYEAVAQEALTLTLNKALLLLQHRLYLWTDGIWQDMDHDGLWRWTELRG